jgi:hypothetical protein
MASKPENLQRPAIKVFVATTVMLTFISYWRAAAIILSDLASSAYYVGGDAEKVMRCARCTSNPVRCLCAAAFTAW